MENVEKDGAGGPGVCGACDDSGPAIKLGGAERAWLLFQLLAGVLRAAGWRSIWLVIGRPLECFLPVRLLYLGDFSRAAALSPPFGLIRDMASCALNG